MNKTIFESASRAAGAHNSDPFTTSGYTGMRVYADVTSVGAAGTVTPKVQVKDHLSGNWVDLPGATFAALSATGTATLSIYPGVAESANESVSDTLGNVLRIVATVATNAVTFSISVDLLR